MCVYIYIYIHVYVRQSSIFSMKGTAGNEWPKGDGLSECGSAYVCVWGAGGRGSNTGRREKESDC